MERFWTKEIRRKLAAVVCAALMVTTVFQNFSTVNAEENGENVFYLDSIQISDDDQGSVSGNTIQIGGQSFVIDENGKLVDPGDVQGVSVSGSDGLVWKNSNNTLDIVFNENNAYFSNAGLSISGNDRTPVNVVLYKKHTLHAKVYIQTAESDADSLSQVENAAVSYINNDDKSVSSGNADGAVAARKNSSGYQAEAKLGNATGRIDANLDPSEPDRIIFRGYIIYGEAGDFYLVDGNDEIIESIEPDRYYHVSKVVMNGKTLSQDNPFSHYKLVVDGNELASGTVSGSDQTVSDISSGSAEILLGFSEDFSYSSGMTFNIDNDKPEITSCQYQIGEEEFTDLSDGTTQISNAGIQLQFTVEEAHGIGEAYITYYENNDSEEKRVEISPVQDENNENVYTFSWSGFSEDIDYRNIGLEVTDTAGNLAEWNSVDTSFIIDKTSPEITEKKYRTGSMEAVSADFGNLTEGIRLIDQNKIELQFEVKEAHGIASATICYFEEGQDEATTVEFSEGSGNITEGDDGTYTISWEVSQKDICYTELGFEVVDKAGNTANWGSATYILDHTAPLVTSVEWRQDGQDWTKIEDGEAVKAQDIVIRFNITEKNNISKDHVCLSYTYTKGGESSETTVALESLTLEGESGEYTLTYKLPDEGAVYTNFKLYLKDEVGNYSTYSSTEQGDWSAGTDNIAPAVTSVEWSQDGQDWTEIEDGAVIKAQDIVIRFNITEKNYILNDEGYVCLSYIKDGAGTETTVAFESLSLEDENGGYTLTYELPDDDAEYTNFKLYLKDEVGNESVYSSTEQGDWSAETDNTAPLVTSVKWSQNDQDWTEIEDGAKIQAQNIFIRFNITEKNSILKDAEHVCLSYIKNGESAETTVELESLILDGESGEYTLSYKLPDDDAVYANFELCLKDEVGNDSTYSSTEEGDWSVVTDNTAPDVKTDEIRWVKTDVEDPAEQEISDNKVNAYSGITLLIPIEEANTIDQNKIEVQYKADGAEPEEYNWEFTEIEGEKVLSIVLPVDQTYTDFVLTLSDFAGNESTYEPMWEIVLDSQEPSVKAEWEKDSESLSTEISDPASCLTAKENITLLFSVQKRMDIQEDTVRLYYTEDGEKKELLFAESSTEGSYGERTYHWIFELEQEANYTDFCLEFKDAEGGEYQYAFSWTAIIDNTAPEAKAVTWTSESGKVNNEAVQGTAVLVDSEKVELKVEVDEKNLVSIALYSQENSDTPLKVQYPEDASGETFTFTIDNANADHNYENLYFKMIDKSGNIKYYGYDDGNSLKVIIDKEEPEISNLTYLYPQEDTWYRDQETPMGYSFTLTDYSEIEKIEMVADGKGAWDLTADCKLKYDRDADGRYTYQISTSADRFAGAADQSSNYYFIITDCWGNKLNTKGSDEVTMLVDNTAPSSAAYVHFYGDKDKFYGSLDEFTGDKQYQYGNLTGTIFNKNEVTLEFYVADLPGAGAIDQAASGIVKARVNYRYTDESITLSKAQYHLESLTYGDDSSDYVISTSEKVTVNNQELDMQKLVFALTVKDGQKITSIDSLELWDAAGNYTVIKEFSSADELTVNYVLDDRAPKLSHVISDGSGYHKDNNTYYYNTNAVDLSVTIEENNFYPDEVSSSLKAGEANKTIVMGEFQDIGSYRYRSRFTMNEGDGIYQFTLYYADRSENAMEAMDGSNAAVANGTYTSPILVLDTTAPVVSIRYYRGGQDITDSITGGKCFSGDVTAVISVTEVNFDPELVQIAFSAMDAADNHAFGISYDPNGWSRNGDTYTYTISCSAEGHYSLTASCTDKAGNQSAGVPASDFTVDKTVPSVTIAYDTTVENGFYNTNRTATVTVTDQNFNEQAVEYVITTTGAQPALTGWTHAGGSGCSGTHHVKSCRWSCQAVFSEDADYTFGFNCTDLAGNISGPVEEQAFTIDQTLPVIQVGYDNNDALNGYYFKEGRTATITITEHNFVSSDVNLAVSSPDGEVHSPSAWRNSTQDVYVCEIPYNTDGDYTFDISYTDPAGNAAQEYGGDQFVIDLTAPELEISGVEDKSANNGVVTPVVSYADKNYDAEEVSIRITGVNHGQVALENTVTINESGQTIEFMDFSHTQEMDDLYTLEAVVTDKAGNSTEESIMFSVNRFGSVYIFSEDTQAVLDRFYTNQGPKLTVTEINVDTLEHQEISYSCDGNIVVLEQGTDYTVQESGAEYEWKQYTYEIAGSNFDTEGVYVVTIQSVDRAANDTTNRLKEKNIEFTVDKSAPSVVLGGIENGGSYAETSRTLTIDAVDNIYLESVDVYLNDTLAVSFDEDTLAEYHGQVSYEVQEAGAAQSVYIIARDAAGNETQTERISFLISSNAFIRWFYNKPLFFGSIAGVLAAAGGIFFLIFWKRRKKDAEEAK